MTRFLNSTSIKTFQKNVTTSGTPVQLTDLSVPDGVKVTIKAKVANTGTITIGGSSADSLNTGTSFFKLRSGESIGLQVTNPNVIWIDATVSLEGVECLLEY